MQPEERHRPRFSVVIPTYNNTPVLMQCLKSLCRQTVDRESFEVIIINDGDDDITDNLKTLTNQLSIAHYNQEHKGPAAARNMGINQARGDIILFLDDDSLPTDNWLEAAMMAWERFNDFDGIGGYTISEPTDSMVSRVNADIFNWYLEKNNSGEQCHFLSTHNAGYKKRSLCSAGRFDVEFKGPSGEDRDLNAKIRKNGGRLRLDRHILVYHDRDLRLGSFLRKYYNYGKAAQVIHDKHPELKRSPGNAYLHLFMNVLKQYSRIINKLLAILLIALSQVATLFGYLTYLFAKFRKKN
ncbi:glycosyltransferase [Acidobacteriota bacterium]